MRFFAIFVIFLCYTRGYTCVQDSIRVQANIVKGKEFSSIGSLEQFAFKRFKSKIKINRGKIAFALPSSVEPGVYRLHLDTLNTKPYIDIIIDGKEPYIIFDIDVFGFEVYPVFYKSIENLKWYMYLDKSKKMINRLDMLFNYLTIFHSKSDTTDRSIINVYQNERVKYYSLFNEFVKENHDRWCGLLVKNRPYYYSDLNKKPIERDFIRKNFFWEGIDTNDYRLINTPLYEELIYLYFEKYYLKPIETYSATQGDFNLKKGIDVALDKFSNNRETKIFIQNFLKLYFECLKRQDLVNYIKNKI